MRRATAGVLVAALVCGAGCSSGGGEPDEVSVSVIEVLGPAESGSGPVPHFEWSDVEGASGYGVVVLDGDRSTVWAWRGPATEVWFGGLSRERPAGLAGPVIAAGSTWRATAFDDDGHIVAISAERDLDPG